ncbi:hypothetical protein RSAG8_08176, partial [Rhizoctonia solani AG-8 WAC10335]
MNTATLPEYHASTLTSLAFKLESYGPVHTVDVHLNEPLNIYIPATMDDTSLRRFLLNEQLRPAALFEDDPDHAACSLTSLIQYSRTNIRFRHAPSKTWRGGPFGICWLVAIYIHFACSFSLFERCRDQISTELVLAFEACNFRRLKASLVSFGDWLVKSLRESIVILKLTYVERIKAWRSAVVSAYLASPDETLSQESVLLDTHGIPHDRSVLCACYHNLQAADPDVTMGFDNVEFCHEDRAIQRKVNWELDEMSDRDSQSGEEIEIPVFDSDDDSTSSEYGDASPLGPTASPEHNFGDPTEGITRGSPGSKTGLFNAVSPSIHPDDESTRSFPTELNAGLVCDSWLSAAAGSLTMTTEQEKYGLAIGQTARTNEDPESEDDLDQLFPNTILTDISLAKLKAAPIPTIPRSRWTMEVVLPTPGRVGAKTSISGPSKLLKNPGQVSPTEPGDRPITEGRRWRSVMRNKQAEDAIRSLPKGRYYP